MRLGGGGEGGNGGRRGGRWVEDGRGRGLCGVAEGAGRAARVVVVEMLWNADNTAVAQVVGHVVALGG